VLASQGLAMKSKKIWEIVSGTNDTVDTALWAVVLAFAIYAIVFIIPNASENQAQSEKIRIGKVAEENALICEKLDMKRGNAKHSQCLLDIGQFRLNVEKRVLDLTY